MTKNFDELINSQQRELNSIKSKMETIRLQFVQATAVFASEWYKQEIKKQVERNPENTLKLGADELKKLKSEVINLSENSRNIAADVLSDSSIWWHLNDKEILDYTARGSYVPAEVDKLVRIVLGRLGEVLEKYGYISRPALYASRHGSYWRELPEQRSYYEETARPYYPHEFKWSEEMKNAINQYNDMHSAAHKAIREIAVLEAEKKRTQAKDLWDSV